jgi:hypothetical protein
MDEATAIIGEHLRQIEAALRECEARYRWLKDDESLYRQEADGLRDQLAAAQKEIKRLRKRIWPNGEDA